MTTEYTVRHSAIKATCHAQCGKGGNGVAIDMQGLAEGPP